MKLRLGTETTTKSLDIPLTQDTPNSVSKTKDHHKLRVRIKSKNSIIQTINRESTNTVEVEISKFRVDTKVIYVSVGVERMGWYNSAD